MSEFVLSYSYWESEHSTKFCQPSRTSMQLFMIGLRRSLIITKGIIANFSQFSPKKFVTKMSTATSIETIREKFESGEYSIYVVPNHLILAEGSARMHANVPDLDVEDSIVNKCSPTWMRSNIYIPTLKATSDISVWQLRIKLFPVQYFKNRDRMEQIMVPTGNLEADSERIKESKISIRAAMKKIRNVCVQCDMEYYLENLEELEADLHRKIPPNLDESNKLEMARLEQELFYNAMCKIFGSGIPDDDVEINGSEVLFGKSFTVRDFQIVSYDECSMIATAVRQNNYFVFFFDS